MIKTAKKQAFKDMVEEGVIAHYIECERDILLLISEDNIIRVDFRRFNGGDYSKHSLLEECVL